MLVTHIVINFKEKRKRKIRKHFTDNDNKKKKQKSIYYKKKNVLYRINVPFFHKKFKFMRFFYGFTLWQRWLGKYAALQLDIAAPFHCSPLPYAIKLLRKFKIKLMNVISI